MQRKMKLVRKILEYVEMSNTEDRLNVPEFDDYSEAEVQYHVGLCEEAGYLVLPQLREEPIRRFSGIFRLTWAGHEALDDMQSGKGTG